MIFARRIFLRQERPAERRLDAVNVEVMRRGLHPYELLRLTIAGEIDPRAGVSGEILV